MNPNITRHIVVDGDVSFVPTGTPVYSYIGGKVRYNVAHGQPIAYLKATDGKVPVTIDVTELDDSNKHRLLIGVGDSSQKNGVVDGIRHLGSEEIGNCDIEAMSVASPTCGNPEVYDMYFDCVSCDETYTIEIGVRDNFTQSYAHSHKDEANWYVSYKPNCKQCNECDRDIECDEVVDGLVANFYQKDGYVMKNGQPYPDFRRSVDDYPFDLHKLYGRSLTYCLSFETPGTECEDCQTLPAFSNVTVGGVAIDLSGITTPTDDTAVFKAQLEQVVAVINEAFDEDAVVNGRAYVTGVNYNTCCPMQLHINTDDVDFVAEDVNGVLTPNVDKSPFGVGEPGEGFTCGIRVIGAPLSEDCDCDLNRLLQSYFRKVRIQAIGEGFVDTREASIQKAEIPGQFGTMIQHMELTQNRGGSGRDFSAGAQRGTWLGNHRKDSHVRRAVTAKCHKDYCSYYTRSRLHFPNQSNQLDSRVMISYFHVESDAVTANAEVKAFLDKMAELSITCADVPTIQCTPLSVAC